MENSSQFSLLKILGIPILSNTEGPTRPFFSLLCSATIQLMIACLWLCVELKSLIFLITASLSRTCACLLAKTMLNLLIYLSLIYFIFIFFYSSFYCCLYMFSSFLGRLQDLEVCSPVLTWTEVTALKAVLSFFKIKNIKNKKKRRLS